MDHKTSGKAESSGQDSILFVSAKWRQHVPILQGTSETSINNLKRIVFLELPTIRPHCKFNQADVIQFNSI